IPVKGQDDKPERLRKLDFRNFDGSDPKLWFDELEVVFNSSHIFSEENKFAALLKLLEQSTSSLLSVVTRSKPVDAYSQARKILIREYSLSKYDRVKEYLLGQPPNPGEHLTHFAARSEVLVEDITMDDIRKFRNLRFAPPAVRLQLAGSRFDDCTVAELLSEADTLTQRAIQDGEIVGAVGNQRKPQWDPNKKEKSKSKVCHFHNKFGKDTHTCTGEAKCILWNESLNLAYSNRPKQGNDKSGPPRG
ncbi:Hypothetical predicted protein, partial [Paramuricea clavata]